jgi:hypothetical protein
LKTTHDEKMPSSGRVENACESAAILQTVPDGKTSLCMTKKLDRAKSDMRVRVV